MKSRSLAWLSLLLVACGSEDLLGPLPPQGEHLTAVVEGQPFVGFIPPGRCMGLQVTPSMMFFSVRLAGPLPKPELSFHLGGVTGPGRFRFRPDQPQDRQIAALYIPGSADTLQYSAVTNSGEVVVDEYDAAQRTIAGRFYFRAIRAVGTSGPEWVDIRQGSFRLRLDTWPPSGCY